MHSFKIAIITDSTCDIPQDLVDQYQIRILPIPVIWGADQYRDRVDLTPARFYERLQTDPLYPTTSQLTEHKYAEAYRLAAEDGAEEVILISLTGALSSTIENARKAAGTAEIPVQVVDSGYVSMGEGFQVLKAARLRDAGAGSAEIIQALELVHQNMVLFAALDTVKYILKGGRLGKAARMIESVLDIKPLVTFSNQDGRVYPHGFARTRKRSIEQMFTQFFEKLDHKSALHICVMHGGAEEDALHLVERIRTEYQPKELLLNYTGTVLGLHTGPKALGLIGYSDEG
jgi:DegV family protein with EDD domain